MDPDGHKLSHNSASKNPALALIRQKISRVYQSEPNAKRELAEAEEAPKRSRHQQFMYDLSTSGKSLAEIQTAWHNYYIGLPDADKHQVWQEFYRENNRSKLYPDTASQPAHENPKPEQSHDSTTWSTDTAKSRSPRSIGELKSEILRRAGSNRKPSHKQHLQSLFFGLGIGSLVVIVLLFSFFNERFLAPFITPSRAVSSTPIIIDPNNAAVGPEPKIIIPKINVELPIIFNEQSIDDKAVETALEDGVIHYPTTPYPGQLGNGAIFGHSSNNILNKGKYKFAFVLLKRLEAGDTFMIQYNSKRYVYKVYDKKIVSPTDLSVLSNTDKPATFTLITCDPPGTSINRLVVWGEQISPDPSGNTVSTASKSTATPKILPSNAPSLWQRIRDWFSS